MFSVSLIRLTGYRNGSRDDEVLNQGKLCEATICYTGDILDPKRDKYTPEYYVKMAKELERRGAHIICIKDMSGLLKPYAAKKLVTALKKTRSACPFTCTPMTSAETRSHRFDGRRSRR